MSNNNLLRCALPVAIAVAAVTTATLTTPAHAAAEWSEPHRLAAGGEGVIQLSDDGTVAMLAGHKPKGQPRGAYSSVFRGDRAGWTTPKMLFETPTSGLTVSAVLNGDGDSALLSSGDALSTGDAYLVADRLPGNRWSNPVELARSAVLLGVRDGRISTDGDVVTWLDTGGVPTTFAAHPPQPAMLLSRSRSADGTWGPVQVVGQMLLYQGNPIVTPALSRDGSEAVWIDTGNDLVSASRTTDGAWSRPALIQRHPFPAECCSRELQLAADGRRVLWHTPRWAWVMSTRTAAGWTAPAKVTPPRTGAVMTPDGTSLITQRSTYRSQGLWAQRYRAGRWTAPKELLSRPRRPEDENEGSLFLDAVSDKAVAWDYCTKWGYADSPAEASCRRWAVEVSLLRGGQWRGPATEWRNARNPVLSRDGRTLAWVDTRTGAMFTVHR